MSQEAEFNKMLVGLLRPANIDTSSLSGLSIRQLFDDRIVALGLSSQNQAESLLGMEHKTLENILTTSGKRIDVVNLIKLSHFLEIPLEKVVELCMIEMPAETIGKIAKSKTSSFIVSNFDLKNLRKGKVKILHGRLSHDEIEERIKRFFRFDSFQEYNSIIPVPAYMRSKKSSNDQMRDFWVTSAYRHFEMLHNPNEYDRTLLVELIPKIRPYTMNEEKGLTTVVKALYKIGVTVIYQPHIPNVQAYGATFTVYDKPCIVITDLNKNYPTIWFALMHELHHVLYDLEEISKRVYHITGEPDLFLIQEEKANDFARQYLFSQERTKYIEPLISTEYVVRQVASEAQVHESFVYSFYNYDRQQEGDKYAWARFKNLIPNTALAVQSINSQVWEKETIEESVKFYKEKVFNDIV